MRTEQLFNEAWEFSKQPIGSDLEKVNEATMEWKKIDVPHDWMIYDPTTFYESSEGWYRKYLTIRSLETKTVDQVLDQLRYILRFEGIYMDSSIYVNQQKVCEWKYGYSTFEVDITAALHEGENEILVHAVNDVPNSRWYSGAGIYRNVWLKIVPKIFLASEGTYIVTEKTDAGWNIRLQSDILSDLNEALHTQNYGIQTQQAVESGYSFRYTLLDADKKNVAVKDVSEGMLKNPTQDPTQDLTQDLTQDQLQDQLQDSPVTITIIHVQSPKLWDIDDPNLYYVKTELLYQGIPVDMIVNRFGFRTISYDTNHGFYLNGRHVKIHGVCQHHDLGALGAAVNKVALLRQIQLLKDMGVNAIRTAHNMCAVELMELADETGMLINSEAFDMWERSKNSKDYARFFTEWAQKDVAQWIRRDRNCPSVIMWTIGNEIYDTHVDERGQVITGQLKDLVYKHDPLQNGIVTIASNYIPWQNAQKCSDLLKLSGYNYAEKFYETHHNLYPDWIIYGSETGSVVQSRGIYHFPLDEEILSDDDEQCSSLGNSITSWGARSVQRCITDDRDATFNAGMFVWTGFDYIGEPTPYHTKNSYFGQLDTAGFKKDSYYMYQAEWTDYRKSPMVHLLPYWDFNEGQLIDVRVCSNAPKVELFVNGLSQGIVEIDHISGHTLVGDWKVPYSKGEIRAVAYDEFNCVIAEDRRCSFTNAEQLVLQPDKLTLKADGLDLVFVEISTVDGQGNDVENANNRIFVRVSGVGRLIGLDNGDSTDYDSYKGTSRRLFSGKLLAIIATKKEPGNITIEVSSAGLISQKLELIAEISQVSERSMSQQGISALNNISVQQGISAIEENQESPHVDEIPIRKLEIISAQGTCLNKQLQEIEVEVKVFPESATFSDITWRVTTASGVDSQNATLMVQGKQAKLKALGDGHVYLRAMAKNGNNKVRLISQLDVLITGLGSAYYNPYEFISGSLYSNSIGEVSSGNERGVATSRHGETSVIYEGLDFGDMGSEEITLPIFELESAPTRIEIWEGIPNTKEAHLVSDVMYHKPSQWNTYQVVTYQLTQRLKGITTLAFLLRSKVHIKGFVFTPLVKAYEKIEVMTYTSIYGDTFCLEEDAITGIGNNVTITFDSMDFSTKGLKKVEICGRSTQHNNTLHVNFNAVQEDKKQIIEFPFSPDYTVREFLLDSITTDCTVSFIFLPGCQFDFKWFKFE